MGSKTVSKHLGVKRGHIDHLEFPKKRRIVSKDDESSSNFDGGGCASTPPITISCLLWNCCGLGNPCTKNELTDLVWAKDPFVVFLAET